MSAADVNQQLQVDAWCMCRARARGRGRVDTAHRVQRSQTLTTHCILTTDPVNHRSYRQEEVSAPEKHITARTEPARHRVAN